MDEYLNKVKNGDGKVIMQKKPVGDFGFYAMIEYTEGNVIGLWQDVK